MSEVNGAEMTRDGVAGTRSTPADRTATRQGTGFRPADDRDGPHRTEVSRWLVHTTRPVLASLAGSTLARLVDQLAGLALFGFGMAGVLGLAGTGHPSLLALLILLVALSLLKALCRYLEQFLGHCVAFKALEILRVESFSALWPQAPAVLAQSRSGDLLRRLTKDVDRVEVFFAHTFAPAVTAVLTPLVAVIGLGALVCWSVAGVLALGLALTLCLPFVEARTSSAIARREAALRGDLNQTVTDSVQGVTEITGYGLEDDRVTGDRRIAQGLTANGQALATVLASRRALARAITVATVLAMTAVGHAESVSVAALAAAVVVGLRCFSSTRAVEDFLTGLDASLASAQRLWRIVHTPPAVTSPDHPAPVPPGQLDVRWEEVTFQYPDIGGESPGEFPGQAAVDGVNAHAKPGEHSCIVGSSGAGKSTLVELALRYFDPDHGHVLVGGADVRRVSIEELRETIVMVPQLPFFFSGSVASNLRLARPDASDEELELACRQARIDDHLRSLPQGYDTEVGELASRWSGGQRARLALARALLTRARVFVVDEYTAHLDGDLAAEVSASLRAARPEATLIEITHRISNSRRADQVIVLDEGRCVEAGPPGELAAADGLYAKMLSREARPQGTSPGALP